MSYYGPIIDISRYQAPLDLDKMYQAGVRLVMLRCTVGNYYTDTEFENYWDMFRLDRRFKLGVYHVVTPEYNAESQLERLFGSLGLNGKIPDVAIALDCELTRGQKPSVITQNILEQMAGVKDMDDRQAIIYTRATWWNVNVLPDHAFADCPLWIARYANLPHPWEDNPTYFKPHSFENWDIWQHSADGNHEGENYGVGSDSVDLNKSNYPDLTTTLNVLNQTQGTPPPMSQAITLYFIVKNLGGVNLRAGPGTNYQDVGGIPYDKSFMGIGLKLYKGGSFWVKLIPDPAWVTHISNEYWACLEYNAGNVLVDFQRADPCG